MSRRSICTGVSFGAHLALAGRPVLLLDEFLDHFLRHRRGSRAAMPAMLDQNSDGDLRILYRRVGNKPGMVTVKVTKLLALEIGAFHLDDLRRARLAGDGDDLGPSRAAGTGREFYDVGEAVAQPL